MNLIKTEKACLKALKRVYTGTGLYVKIVAANRDYAPDIEGYADPSVALVISYGRCSEKSDSDLDFANEATLDYLSDDMKPEFIAGCFYHAIQHKN